jgi:(-)-germacrene D synthase
MTYFLTYPTTVSMPLVMSIPNLACVIDVIYKDKDGYTNAGVVLKDFVASLFVELVLL